MYKIKRGDIVGRKSYEKDIIFMVININEKENIAILKGIYERIEADSPISDLEIVEKNILNKRIKKKNERIRNQIEDLKRETKEKAITGKILHLDGDKKYSYKSYMYYKKSMLNSVVKNIPEYRQPKEVYRLLFLYNPDILIVTGHDGMLNKKSDFDTLDNYRNSRYFIEAVKEARRYEKDYFKNLVIFAGACQSYYEALIGAGANFASSPSRILIDFVEPLIVAKNIALTDKKKYITIDDFYKELKNGKAGISGIGAYGKAKKQLCNICEINL